MQTSINKITYKNSIIRQVFTCIFLSFFLLSFSPIPIFSESYSNKKKYLKNLSRVEEFKRNMSQKEREYYEPRKRFIEKQSVRPKGDFFYQIDLILIGTAIREKNRWNIKEIRKLEKFLVKADDFQLNRYFSGSEEIYLRLPATKAIRRIKSIARQDENWRIKNDPYFIHYLKYKATNAERNFYKRNKALFYRPESGIDLIQFLKSQVPSVEKRTKDYRLHKES